MTGRHPASRPPTLWSAVIIRARYSQPAVWVAIGLAVVCILILGFGTQTGFSGPNIARIISSAVPLGIVAIAQTLVVINRGLDLSVGAVMNTSAIVAALLNGAGGAPLWLVVVAAIAIGTAAGSVNGLLFAFTKIPPLLGTLATAAIFGGVNQILTGGQPKGSVGSALRWWADANVGGTSLSPAVGAWIVMLVAVSIWLRRTVSGWEFLASGTNPTTAAMHGVRVRTQTFGVYVVSGVLAAVAGLVLIGYAGAPSLTAGDQYALNSVVVVVIGGASLFGGIGSMLGAFAGTIVIGMLGAVLNSFGIPVRLQLVINGLVLIAMLFVNSRLTKGRRL